MSTPEDSTKRQGLVKKLVQLRLKLQELKVNIVFQKSPALGQYLLTLCFFVCIGNDNIEKTCSGVTAIISSLTVIDLFGNCWAKR